MFFRVRAVGSAERILSSFLLELSLQLVNIILMHFKLSCSGAHHLKKKIYNVYIVFSSNSFLVWFHSKFKISASGRWEVRSKF